MERRRNNRSATNREVVAHDPASPIKARILDLSVSGCKALSDSRQIAPGVAVLIDLSENTTIGGQVVWRESDLFGVRFDQNISVETVTLFTQDESVDIKGESFVRDRFGRRLPNLGAGTYLNCS